ncbi:steroidogenic acute regulatory protein-like [Copidosoma floridanum]|uniref:steroidogenic acute regulatory protein-like n=1 Tax=Copidosoma floridanum TaxID=29053 RepID=UPI0006C9CC3B|nr:steroidogenic acute regulatory protein-like [Copidosoma floridanum]
MPRPNRPNTLITDDHRIRMAAESALNVSLTSPRVASGHSQSLMTPDAMGEILIGGIRHDGRMSNVRRFFCLFVTFDFFFTFFLWMFCIVISGANVQTAFVDEIIHYQIKTSLSDVVALAALRFVILLFFYAVLQIDHWSIVALTTSSTCAFLLAKVFLYTWTQSKQPLFEVLFILISFVLVWGEAWFLDIKVVPQESLVRDWYSGYANLPSERDPLLGPGSIVPSVVASRENAGHFYTPMDSPDHSDDENHQTHRKESSSSFLSANLPVKLPQEKVDETKRQATALPKICYDIITSLDWKVEKITSEGDIVSSMYLPKPDGKIFKITGKIKSSAAKVINDLYDNIEINCTWNKQISESKKIYAIDKNIDFVYQGTSPLANGALGPRDFVILRHKAEINSYLMSCGASANFAVIPLRKNFVRGENGVGCYAARALDDETCEFVWLVNTHLKGWVPQKMVDMFMPIGMIEFIVSLRQHVRDLKD